MNKFLCAFLIIFILCVCMSCCNEDVTEPLSNDEIFQMLFDEEMQEMPTNEEMAQIQPGMSYTDVVKLIGRPHGLTKASMTGYVKWVTVEGDTYVVFFGVDDNLNSDVDNLLDYFNNSYVINIRSVQNGTGDY